MDRRRTHSGPAFGDFLAGSLPNNTGRKMRFTGTTVLKVEDGLIVSEIGLDDGVTALTQLGLLEGCVADTDSAARTEARGHTRAPMPRSHRNIEEWTMCDLILFDSLLYAWGESYLGDFIAAQSDRGLVTFEFASRDGNAVKNCRRASRTWL